LYFICIPSYQRFDYYLFSQSAVGTHRITCEDDIMMTIDTASWWTLLRGIAAINLVIWTAAALYLYRSQATMHPETFAMRRWQLLLSAIYVLGCGFRSIIPVFDVPRVVMVDSWLSSVLIGRSVATIAELSFVAQWAVLLRETSRWTGSNVGALCSRLVFPMIVVAEVFSWYSVLTTSNIGHVVEESLWGLAAAMLVTSLIAMGPHCSKAQRRALDVCCILGIAYVAYMFTVDVPRYWIRWIEDEAQGRQYLSVTQGLFDVSTRWVVSHNWEIWKGESTWMSLYFSVAVWLSIYFVHAPVPQKQTRLVQRGIRTSSIA
jgi:hypothetical protein